jgi:hypothetical protein
MLWGQDKQRHLADIDYWQCDSSEQSIHTCKHVRIRTHICAYTYALAAAQKPTQTRNNSGTRSATATRSGQTTVCTLNMCVFHSSDSSSVSSPKTFSSMERKCECSVLISTGPSVCISAALRVSSLDNMTLTKPAHTHTHVHGQTDIHAGMNRSIARNDRKARR